MLPTERNAQLAARWRNENREAYSSWVTATPESALAWLRGFHEREDRILFLVQDEYANPVGHFGAVILDADEGLAEIVSAVRGSPDAPPGFFYVVYHTVTQWLFRHAGARTVVACALDSNPKPTRVMARCGYRVVGADHVRLVQSGDTATWTKISNGRLDHKDRLMIQLECTQLLPRNDE